MNECDPCTSNKYYPNHVYPLWMIPDTIPENFPPVCHTLLTQRRRNHPPHARTHAPDMAQQIAACDLSGCGNAINAR